MSYQTKIGPNKEISLPDEICHDLNIEVGAIFLCEFDRSFSKIILTKYSDQTLSDTEIESAGNLTRVIAYPDVL